MKPKIRTLDHLVLTVANIPETIRFYTEVLGTEVDLFQVADGSVRSALKFGQQKINLHQQGQEFEPKAARTMPGSADLCFLTDMALPIWMSHLKKLDILIEEGPVARTGATGPISSLYLRDPDGNLIEISALTDSER